MMHDPPRPRDRQLNMTRGHLYALIAMALALSVATFFLGIQIGRRDVPAATVTAATEPPLVKEEARDGSLEVLLARVEQARPGSVPLEFPSVLPVTDPPPAIGEGAVVPPAPGLAPRAGDIPKDGWALETGIFPEVNAADNEVARLRAAGLSAYRVTSLINGQPNSRVRIGGYKSEADALAAVAKVSEAAPSATPKVVKAP